MSTKAGVTQPKSDLLQGTLDLLILRSLALAPMHGWAISQRINQITEDALRVNQGSLYPALHRLEVQGWVASELGTSDQHRRVRVYSLTPAGQQQLAMETENWERISVAIGRILRTAY